MKLREADPQFGMAKMSFWLKILFSCQPISQLKSIYIV